VILEDRLVVGPQEPGLVIFHHGDPAYRRSNDDPRELPLEEAIFLRIIAYVAFTEAICVPTRYVLQGDAMFKAMRLAEPLLRLGVVRPERRAEATSAEDLARILELPEAVRRRGAWLDEKAKETRSFRSERLAESYREILTNDLAPGGGLRLALQHKDSLGAKRYTEVEKGLDQAHQLYVDSEDGTPEAFYKTVQAFAPRAASIAQRWAMARYYLTPTNDDTLNTREIPDSAARLLERGKVLPKELRPMDVAAPVNAAYVRLHYNLPAQKVSGRALEYCEAVMQVREAIPQARTKFREVRERADLGVLTDELTRLMVEELKRQEGLRRDSGITFATLLMALAGGGVGFAASAPHLGFPLDLASALGTGVATGVGVKIGESSFAGRRERRRAPWPLVIDRLENKVR
jgi:hypothetical protein